MTDQSKYTSKLKGKKVLIIGGSSGIGFAVAEASLEHGANVFIASSKREKIQAAIERLQNAYPSAKDRLAGHQIDVAETENVEANLRKILEKIGKLDHIIWTASTGIAPKPIAEIDLDFIKTAQATRFIAPVLLAKLAFQYLDPAPESSLIFTSGTVSERPLPNWVVTNFLATGLHGLTRALALDMRPIRVNLVCPGGVDTPLWDRVPEERRKLIFDSYKRTTTRGSIAVPEDVAESYIYLMKDSNITGSIISTNGGSLLLGAQ